jgi:RHS repeat-associated protein
LIETIHPDGSREQPQYDIANNHTGSLDGNGQRGTTVYDARGRRIREIDALGNITRFEYDAANQLIAQVDANGNRTQYRYDDLGRQVAVIDAQGNMTRTEYDKNGNVTAQIDALGNRTEYRFDNRDRQIQVIDANNTLLPEALRKFTATTYDAVGNVLSITDPLGNRTSYTYDGLNRLISDTNELNKTRTYGYDAAGNRISMSDRNGRTTHYFYDNLNRQTAEIWLNGTGNGIRTITSTYDAASQLNSVSDPDSSYAFTYDLRGRLQTVDNQGTPSTPRVLLTYTYDANGNIISVFDAINGTNAGTTAYTYDVLNRVTQVTQTGTGVQTKRVDFGYNPVGQFDSIRRYSDLAGTQLVVDTRYSYDGLNRLQGLLHNRADGATVASYSYGYDSSGRITSIASLFANSNYNDTTTYNYDNTSQLTGADHSAISDESYQYDANGNRLNYQTGSNNQLLSDGTYNYTYDDEGNLKTRTEIATGQVREFTWDYRNRLVGVVDNGVTTATYTYDAFNQRIAKTVEGQTTRFVYDRGNVYLEFSGNSSAPSTRYLYGPMVDQILAQESATATPENETTWMLTDHLGSVRDLVNNTGTVVNHFTYDSFGNVVGSMTGGVDTRYKYTGREFDQETGLHYYRARYFDAQVGRFISQDPLGFGSGDGSNLYAYVTNQPVNRVDPSGLYGIVHWQTRTIDYMDNGRKMASSIQEVAHARKKNPNVYVFSDITTAWIGFSKTQVGTGTRNYNRKYIPDFQQGIDVQGHIVGKQLGGSGTDLKNLFP